MSFKPIYWYYGNNKFSSEEICKLKSNIDKIDAEKLTENNNCISTFVYCENDRPDVKYNDMYSKIVKNITKNEIYPMKPFPELIGKIIESGGLFKYKP